MPVEEREGPVEGLSRAEKEARAEGTVEARRGTVEAREDLSKREGLEARGERD